MSISLMLLGIILLIPVIYFAAGFFCASALGGAAWAEFILDWYRPVLIIGALAGCAIGGPWALLTGLGVL